MSDSYDKETLDLAQRMLADVNEFGRSCYQRPDQEHNAKQWGDVLAIVLVNSKNVQGLIDRLEPTGARAAALVALGFGYRAGLRAARKSGGAS